MAGFLLGHATQEEIARREDVNRQTINADVKALREAWRKELIDDPVAIKAQELAELNDMERDCIRGYALTHDRVWISERRLIKERKAKLLGLDAPVRQEHTGPEGGPIKQDLTVITDALDEAETRDTLDALSQRLESHAGGNGRQVVQGPLGAPTPPAPGLPGRFPAG